MKQTMTHMSITSAITSAITITISAARLRAKGADPICEVGSAILIAFGLNGDNVRDGAQAAWSLAT